MPIQKKKPTSGNKAPKNKFTSETAKIAGAKGGRKRMSKEEKALALSSRTQFKLCLAKYANHTLDDIKKLLAQAKLPIIEMAVLRHLQEAFTNGSMDRIDWTANHIMGKPKEVQHHRIESTLETTGIDLKKLNSEQLEQLAKIVEAAEASDKKES